MASMRDVAAAAGVSAKTVSRVFNGDPHVLPETRSHVEQVMRELNYVPNDLATTFRSGRSSAIGVAVPDIVDPFFAQLARAVDGVARARGAATLLTNLGEDPAHERDILESLLSRKLAGLVLAPIGTDHAWLNRWKDSTPLVFVDRAPVGLLADIFSDDDEGGGYLGTHHLIEHGHRRIAYVGARFDLSTEINRQTGYRRALEGAGIAVDDTLVAGHVADRETAATVLAQLLALPDPPTAVFSGNARTSMAMLPFLQKHPLAIVSFGDFPTADVLVPALTVIDQDPTVIGTSAAERIFARLENPQGRLSRVNVLDVALIERESCSVTNS